MFLLILFFVPQLPAPSSSSNPFPFRYPVGGNAYMLVYIRECDKGKLMCDFSQKDIAEHVRVERQRIKEENYTTLKVTINFKF